MRLAEMPVAGLALDETDATLNGVPFGDLSASEQIKVGLALGLAANPKLRVALVRDGSLLDDDAYAVLGAWAEQHDAQVLVETVGKGRGADAVVIEDGAVVGAPADDEETDDAAE